MGSIKRIVFFGAILLKAHIGVGQIYSYEYPSPIYFNFFYGAGLGSAVFSPHQFIGMEGGLRISKNENLRMHIFGAFQYTNPDIINNKTVEAFRENFIPYGADYDKILQEYGYELNEDWPIDYEPFSITKEEYESFQVSKIRNEYDDFDFNDGSSYFNYGVVLKYKNFPSLKIYRSRNTALIFKDLESTGYNVTVRSGSSSYSYNEVEALKTRIISRGLGIECRAFSGIGLSKEALFRFGYLSFFAEFHNFNNAVVKYPNLDEDKLFDSKTKLNKHVEEDFFKGRAINVSIGFRTGILMF